MSEKTDIPEIEIPPELPAELESEPPELSLELPAELKSETEIYLPELNFEDIAKNLPLMLRPPNSFSDYVEFGRILIAKKLLIIISFMLLGICTLFAIEKFSPQEKTAAPTVPIFSESDANLLLHTGEVIITNSSGSEIYRGMVENGVRQGFGRSYNPPMIAYEGEFDQNAFNGKGKLYERDGELIYDGSFENGQYHGLGRLYKYGRILYDGSFDNGLYSGFGILYKGNRILYRGDFEKGVYHGTGQLFENENPLYDGDFQNGYFHGNGTLYSNGRAIYTGDFALGMKDGMGIEYDELGNLVYEGQFSLDNYNGSGTLYSAGGARLNFQGEFVAGKPSREGKIYNAFGNLLYEGAVYNQTPDVMYLIGESLGTWKDCFIETPIIYYTSTHTAFLYRELGITAVVKINPDIFSDILQPQEKPIVDFEAESDEIDLSEYMIFINPADDDDNNDDDSDDNNELTEILLGEDAMTAFPDNLAILSAVASSAVINDEIPSDEQGISITWRKISGFEAFTIARHPFNIDLPDELADTKIRKRANGIFEVSGLPAIVFLDANGAFDTNNFICYLWNKNNRVDESLPIYIRKVKNDY